MSASGATPGGDLNLQILNQNEVDINTLPGLSYATSYIADANGELTLSLATSLDSPDVHRLTLRDLTNGQTSTVAVQFGDD